MEKTRSENQMLQSRLDELTASHQRHRTEAEAIKEKLIEEKKECEDMTTTALRTIDEHTETIEKLRKQLSDKHDMEKQLKTAITMAENKVETVEGRLAGMQESHSKVHEEFEQRQELALEEQMRALRAEMEQAKADARSQVEALQVRGSAAFQSPSPHLSHPVPLVNLPSRHALPYCRRSFSWAALSLLTIVVTVPCP